MRILIIEDEARISNRIERMLKSIFVNQLKFLAKADSVTTGLTLLDSSNIDLLFLDLNLNGEDGFDILEEVVSGSFHTIVVSAYRERAIKAFEYGVLDFVPKPFDQDRIAKACSRVFEKQEKPQELRFLAIKKKGVRQLLKVADIQYIQGAGIYTEVFQKNGKKDIHNKSLENLHLLLPSNFERIHKSFLVCMDEAKEIVSEPGSKYYLVLHDGTRLPIGRTRYKLVEEKWFK